MGVFIIIDTNGDGIPDQYSSSSVYVDLKAPPSPESAGVTVEGGDQALVVRWPKTLARAATKQADGPRYGQLQASTRGTGHAR